MGTTELQRFMDNKSLTALKKFAIAEAKLAVLKEKHDAVIEQIKEAMIANDVQKIDGSWGYITLTEQTTYKAIDIAEVNEQYVVSKPTLDLAKVKAQAVLTGEIPAGVTETKTQYITKKLKEV